MLSHWYCNFSLTCIDWADIKLCIESGERYLSKNIQCATANELPFSVYQAVTQIQASIGSNQKISGIVLTLAGNDRVVGLEHFEASSLLCQGLLDDSYIVSHTNLSPERAIEAHVLAVINENQVEQVATELLDIPAFLK